MKPKADQVPCRYDFFCKPDVLECQACRVRHRIRLTETGAHTEASLLTLRRLGYLTGEALQTAMDLAARRAAAPAA